MASPGSELGHARRGERLPETRIFVEVGIAQRHHARRLAGHGEVERSDIEIADLVRREQSEAPPPGDNAGDIVGFVEMGADDAGIADPDPRNGNVLGQAAANGFSAAKTGQDLGSGTEPT